MTNKIDSKNGQLQTLSKTAACLTDLPDELLLRVIALSGDEQTGVKLAYNLSAVCSRFRRLLISQFLPSIQEITLRIISPLSLANSKVASVALTSFFSHTSKVKEVNLGGVSPNILSTNCFSALSSSAFHTLTKVNLAYCTVTDSCISPILRCPNLRHLSLPSCMGVTGSMFYESNVKAPLEFLDVSWVHTLTDEGVRAIAQISTIKELVLTGCNVVRRRNLQSFLNNDIRNSLQTIWLSYCPIPEDSLADLLERTPNLRTLILAEDTGNIWGTGEFTPSVIHLLRNRFPKVSIELKF